jgi:GNAT superfamily N-acetyltransferase
MWIYNRPFNERQKDFEEMWQLLIDDYSDKKDQFIWTIGRLGDWKYGCWDENKCIPNFMRKNAQLWFNNFDELIGFVISENCDSNFSILSKRGYEFLYSEMLVWVKTNWSNREGELATEVHEFQYSFIDSLQKEGFNKKNLIAVTRQYNLCDKAEEIYFLGNEYAIEDMFINPDLEGKVKLYNNAWRNENEITKYDLLKYEYNRESPCFNPKFDLSVVDRNGLHISSCVAFIDYKNNYAEIEKVCTHTEYRRKGFAEAVIRECFKRLYSEGIQYAYITGYSTGAKSLYDKLGAIKTKNWFQYSK